MKQTVFCLVLTVLSFGAFGNEPQNVSPFELSQLPPYCADKQWLGSNIVPVVPAERTAYWLARLGPSWKGLHHYCWGLVNVRRAQGPGLPKAQRAYLLSWAINDYTYALRNSTPGFVLAPEILLRMAEAHALNNDPAAAIDVYSQSRALKPDYWPAYTEAIELLIKLHLRDRAKQLAIEGLRRAPEGKQLAELYRQLGGDPATIAPSPATPAASASRASAPDS